MRRRLKRSAPPAVAYERGSRRKIDDPDKACSGAHPAHRSQRPWLCAKPAELRAWRVGRGRYIRQTAERFCCGTASRPASPLPTVIGATGGRKQHRDFHALLLSSDSLPIVDFREDFRPLDLPKFLKGLVGAARFELATPSPPDWCANRAALRSEHQGPDGPGFKTNRSSTKLSEKHRQRGALSASSSGEKLDRAVSTDFRTVWQLKTCSMLCAQTITMVIQYL